MQTCRHTIIHTCTYRYIFIYTYIQICRRLEFLHSKGMPLVSDIRSPFYALPPVLVIEQYHGPSALDWGQNLGFLGSCSKQVISHNCQEWRSESTLPCVSNRVSGLSPLPTFTAIHWNTTHGIHWLGHRDRTLPPNFYLLDFNNTKHINTRSPLVVTVNSIKSSFFIYWWSLLTAF